jgi:beta-lactamase class D
MGWMLRRIGYGNADISGGIDRFWLNSTLQISPDEQVELLTRLVRGEMPFTQRDLDILRTIMTAGGKPGVYVLRGKTGAGPAPDGEGAIGWFVGYLEKHDGTYTFATLLRGPDYPSIADKRIPATQDALKRLGLIEE